MELPPPGARPCTTRSQAAAAAITEAPRRGYFLRAEGQEALLVASPAGSAARIVRSCEREWRRRAFLTDDVKARGNGTPAFFVLAPKMYYSKIVMLQKNRPERFWLVVSVVRTKAFQSRQIPRETRRGATPSSEALAAPIGIAARHGPPYEVCRTEISSCAASALEQQAAPRLSRRRHRQRHPSS